MSPPLNSDPPMAPGRLVMVGGSMPPVAFSDGQLVTAQPRTRPDPIGRSLRGRYRIKRLIGEGGMGGVYEGEHLAIGKRVAIKLVHADYEDEAAIAARLKREARAASAVESEHIVQVFDVGEDEKLGIYLVMELLHGEDLSSLLARRGRLSPRAACALALQATHGLARAHAAGIVHRDLKPANIFVCTRDDGSLLIKLVDFGIAKVIRDSKKPEGPGLTRMGTVVGTPQYMSPEQAQGLPSVDHRTDVYSMGAVLFEMLAGRSPFPELPTARQTIVQIITRQPPRLLDVRPDVPRELDRLVSDMMALDPSLRPADMNAVRHRLLRAFPEIEASRAAMNSWTSEASMEETQSATAPKSNRGLDESFHTHVGHAPQQTHAGMTLDPARGTHGAPPSTPFSQRVPTKSLVDDDESSISASARRRQRVGVAAAVSVLLLAAGVGGAAVAQRRGASEKEASAGFGLVQPSEIPSPPAADRALVAPASAPAPQTAVAAPAPQVTTPGALASAAASLPAVTHAPAVTMANMVAAAPRPRAAAHTSIPRAPTANAPEGSASRPVGGTGLASEF